ncbi:MFS transporter [Baekduia soli]|uniref:MFS transporter n=1 Tax=Baekduia soli TaxID=496014 RepID=A0A5B8U7S0_9ACTN|nr:MFS transporter [Baekduia soli]QEC48848.1 MFS transporter [Baekduia soli]
MYQVQDSTALLRARRRYAVARRTGRPFVARTVLLLGLTSLFTDISSEMVSAVLPMYLVLFRGLDPLQFGVVNGIAQGGAALVRVVFGFAADRMGRYREMAGIGYGVSAVCRLGLLLAGSFGALGGVVLADRVGKGIRTAPRDAMIALSTEPAELGTAFGVHRAMDTCGAMLGPLVAFALLALAPREFHGIFLVSFCFALIGVAILALLVQDPARAPQERRPGVAPEPAAPPPSVRSASALLRGGPLGGLVLVAFVLGMATIGDAFLYLQLDARRHFDASLFPLLYVGTSAMYMVMAVPAGRLADRAGRGRVFAGGYLLLLAVYAALLSGAHTVLLVPATLVGLGLFYAMTDGVLAALGAAAVPSALRGTGLAVLGTATGVAQFGASIAFGALWMSAGAHDAFVIFSVALLAAIAVAAVVLLRRPAAGRAAAA